MHNSQPEYRYTVLECNGGARGRLCKTYRLSRRTRKTRSTIITGRTLAKKNAEETLHVDTYTHARTHSHTHARTYTNIRMRRHAHAHTYVPIHA